ncbi:DUF2807 domain-containing protein [Luteimonas sp. SJ-92]|uniref:DUF2807 domain-containing protein n=1 Tax=Luteimonas salinisoli TaxID=2752307 RepID=A0A853JBC3_9GAMM|nr:DUF2807 domain-containing protein [Luteimonas salinisoli]NZA25949.1 DUF2807 domain-containing protein [Luteimonas salinisoli]
MKPIAIALLLLVLPAAADAQDRRCRESAPQELQLDLSGVKTVMFDIGHNKLRLEALSGADGRLSGRACASSAARLDELRLTQEREGDRLLVRAGREGGGVFSFGNAYAYLDLSGQVPDDVLVQLKVGSGDAWLTGAAAMSADVGSGDVEAKRIRGLVTAKVGSGDIVLDDIGALKVLSIGSGDIKARSVRGDVEVGSIGSGDFELRGAGGDVEIGSIGSGDAELDDVAGSVAVGSIGSGDLEIANVRGDLTVRSKGSGSVDHSGVAGAVDVPRRR